MSRANRSCIGRLFAGILVGAVIAAVGVTAAYLYLEDKDRSLVDETVASLDALAGKFESGDESAENKSKIAEKLRDLGAYLDEHGPEIDQYGVEVEEKLSKISELSEDAYRAAKEKVDALREGKSEDAPPPPAEETPPTE